MGCKNRFKGLLACLRRKTARLLMVWIAYIYVYFTFMQGVRV